MVRVNPRIVQLLPSPGMFPSDPFPRSRTSPEGKSCPSVGWAVSGTGHGHRCSGHRTRTGASGPVREAFVEGLMT